MEKHAPSVVRKLRAQPKEVVRFGQQTLTKSASSLGVQQNYQRADQ